MQSNATVIVPARLDSSRLPNKALLPYAGLPFPELLRRRLGSLPLVFAVPDKRSDDPIADQCDVSGVPVVRGPLHNPLELVAEAARVHDAEVVVRATCDNPALDERAVRAGLEAFHRTDKPAACNLHYEDRTDPYGYFVDVAARSALEHLLGDAPTGPEREHVTLGLKARGLCEWFSVLDADRSGLDWSVDTADDYRKMSRLFAECGADASAEELVRATEGVN